jgi:hypothetical protein
MTERAPSCHDTDDPTNSSDRDDDEQEADDECATPDARRLAWCLTADIFNGRKLS